MLYAIETWRLADALPMSVGCIAGVGDSGRSVNRSVGIVEWLVSPNFRRNEFRAFHTEHLHKYCHHGLQALCCRADLLVALGYVS